MRKKDDTLRDTLLSHARNVVETEGVDAINIRSIAKMADISVGTVYNYFSSKDDIFLALTQEYWKKTLQEMRKAVTAELFWEQIEQIYLFLNEHIKQSGGMLMKSLANVETTGKELMSSMQKTVVAQMIDRMDKDNNVRTDIWDDNFTKEQYVSFIMMNMMMLLRTKSTDINFFIELIKRTIY